MQIKKGDRFLCIKNVEMDGNPDDISYIKDKIYVSEEDGCITDEGGNTNHWWNVHTYNTEDCSKYFSKIVGEFSQTEYAITAECDKLKEMLLDKNRKYGDSALSYGSVFKISPVTALKARINDKIARLKNDNKDEDEDIILDLLGYFILLRIAISKEK
jgi:hypothetical protein